MLSAIRITILLTFVSCTLNDIFRQDRVNSRNGMMQWYNNGPNQVFGPNNKIDGKYNTVLGQSNNIQGYSNNLKGGYNQIRGSTNYIQGYGNIVMGTNNNIQGSNNNIKPLDNQALNKLFNEFTSRVWMK